MKYSKLMKGFYHESQKDMPWDAVDITDADYAEMMRGQAAGHVICDAHEKLTLVPRPGPTWDELRIARNRYLSESDWTQLADAPDPNKSAWAKYRQDLRDLPATYPDAAFVVWPTPPL